MPDNRNDVLGSLRSTVKQNDDNTSGTIKENKSNPEKNYVLGNVINLGITDGGVQKKDLNDYTDYIENPVISPNQDLDAMRANNQSGWEQAGNMAFTGVVGGLLTALESASYLFDPTTYGAMAFQELDSYERNWFADLAQSGKEHLYEAMPIYRKNPNQVFDWSDFGWYMETLRGVVDSAVGFGLPGMGVAGVVAKGAKALRGLSYASKAAKLSKYMLRTEKGNKLVQSLASGYLSNHMETMVMASEMYDTMINDPAIAKAVKDGIISWEDARAEIGRQTANFANANKIFAVTNALQLGSLVKTRGQLSKTGFKNFAIDQLKTAPLEGLEEMGQATFQNLAEDTVRKNLGLKEKFGGTDLMSKALEIMASEEVLLESMMGLFGGPVQYAITKAPFEIANAKKSKKWAKNQAEVLAKNKKYVENIAERTKKYEALQRLAKDKKDDALADQIAEVAFENIAVENFIYGIADQLENSLNDIIEDKSNHYTQEEKKIAEQKLESLKELENEWNDSTRYENPEQVFMLRTKKKHYDRMKSLNKEKVTQTYQDSIDEVNSELTFLDRENVIRNRKLNIKATDTGIELDEDLGYLNVEDKLLTEAQADSKKKVLAQLENVTNQAKNKTVGNTFLSDYQNVLDELDKVNAELKEVTSFEHQEKLYKQAQADKDREKILNKAKNTKSISELEKQRDETKDEKTKEEINKIIKAKKQAQESKESEKETENQEEEKQKKEKEAEKLAKKKAAKEALEKAKKEKAAKEAKETKKKAEEEKAAKEKAEREAKLTEEEKEAERKKEEEAKKAEEEAKKDVEEETDEEYENTQGGDTSTEGKKVVSIKSFFGTSEDSDDNKPSKTTNKKGKDIGKAANKIAYNDVFRNKKGEEILENDGYIPLLDPNKNWVGSEILLEVDKDYALENPEDLKDKDKAPIAVYELVDGKKGRKLGGIPTPAMAKNDGNSQADIDKLNAVREAVFENGAVTSKITEQTSGRYGKNQRYNATNGGIEFEYYSIKNKQFEKTFLRPISSAFGKDVLIGYKGDKNGKYSADGHIYFVNSKGVRVRLPDSALDDESQQRLKSKEMNMGQHVALFQTGIDTKGNPIYKIYYIRNNKLSTPMVDTIINALDAYGSQDPVLLKRFKDAGYDISTPDGIQNYIQLFTVVRADDNVPQGLTAGALIRGANNIQIAIPANDTVDSNNEYSLIVSHNFKERLDKSKKARIRKILESTFFTMNAVSYQGTVPSIDENGNVTELNTAGTSYMSWVGENMFAEHKSYPIHTTDKNGNDTTVSRMYTHPNFSWDMNVTPTNIKLGEEVLFLVEEGEITPAEGKQFLIDQGLEGSEEYKKIVEMEENSQASSQLQTLDIEEDLNDLDVDMLIQLKEAIAAGADELPASEQNKVTQDIATIDRVINNKRKASDSKTKKKTTSTTTTKKADIERRRDEVKLKIGQNKDGREIRKNILKGTKIENKSLRQAMLDEGYVDFMGILIHPNTPVEIFDRIDSKVFELAKKEGVEFFNYQENEGNHGMMQSLSDNTGKKYGIMLSSGLRNLNGYRTEQAKIERTNHLVLHELGHVLWETKLTKEEKENANKLELKSNYAKSVTDSMASRHEENYVENYAAAMTQRLYGYSFLPQDQLNPELQEEINAKYDAELTTKETQEKANDETSSTQPTDLSKVKLILTPNETQGEFRVIINADKGEVLVTRDKGADGKFRWVFSPKQKDGAFRASDPDTGQALNLSQENIEKILKKYLPQSLIDALVKADNIKGVDNQQEFLNTTFKPFTDTFEKEILEYSINQLQQDIEYYESDGYKKTRSKDAVERVLTSAKKQLKELQDRLSKFLENESTKTKTPLEKLQEEKQELEEEKKQLEEEKKDIETELKEFDEYVKKTLENITDKEVTEEELEQIAEEEGVSKEEAKSKLVDETVKQFNEKNPDKPKTLLQKIGARLKRLLLNILIATTLINASAFTFQDNQNIAAYETATIENLSPFEKVFADQEAK